MRFPTKDVAYHFSPSARQLRASPWTTTFIAKLGGCGEQTDDDVSEIISAPMRERCCYVARSYIRQELPYSQQEM